jgi:hypothetical protein
MGLWTVLPQLRGVLLLPNQPLHSTRRYRPPLSVKRTEFRGTRSLAQRGGNKNVPMPGYPCYADSSATKDGAT